MVERSSTFFLRLQQSTWGSMAWDVPARAAVGSCRRVWGGGPMARGGGGVEALLQGAQRMAAGTWEPWTLEAPSRSDLRRLGTEGKATACSPAQGSCRQAPASSLPAHAHGMRQGWKARCSPCLLAIARELPVPVHVLYIQGSITAVECTRNQVDFGAELGGLGG